MKYLVIFAIGPVQSYIEASRSSRDLFASSAILSSIALAGIQTAQGFGEVIYPKLDSGEPPAGVPHRFTITTEKDPAVAAKAVQEAVQKQWKEEIAGKVRSYLAHIWGDGEWQNIFDRQVNNWLEFYWVAVTYHPASHSECIGKANIAMAARKSIRNFPQIAEKGVKCTLTGVQSALTDSTKMWDKVREKMNDTISDDGDYKLIRSNEKLGAIAVIKRLAVFAKVKLTLTYDAIPSVTEIAQAGFPPGVALSKDTPLYYAVLHMDGDRIGKHLGGISSLSEHGNFSQKLAQFAKDFAGNIVEYNKGRLVYAGGDDVLAFLPVQTALQCADDLRSEFAKLTGLTASAGIAIAPDTYPLDLALEAARSAEDAAKEIYGRNAVSISIITGSAETRKVGGSWSNQHSPDTLAHIIQTLMLFMTPGTAEALQQAFAENTAKNAAWLGEISKISPKESALSSSIGYDLYEVIYSLGLESMKDALSAELKRIIRRRLNERIKNNQAIAELETLLFNYITTLAEGSAQVSFSDAWRSAMNWLIIARFLAKGGIA